MRGDRVVDEGVEFIVIYDGSHQGKDLDLFVPIEAPKPEPRAAHSSLFKAFDPDEPIAVMEKRRIQSERAERDRKAIMRLLRHRSVWHVSELRVASQLRDQKFWSALARLRETGVTEHPSVGYVQLVRRQREAA